LIHLASVRYIPDHSEEHDHYPFRVPLIRSLETLAFSKPVTILVGENGTGKSTLLEAIAAAANCTTVGSESIATDRSLGPARSLSERLKLSWKQRSHQGFFLRSEDFFNFCRRVEETRSEMLDEARRVETEYADKSLYTQARAKDVFLKSVGAMESRYGADLDANSHGESFLKLFSARFVPNGLYILDEPESPLSPTRQLALIAMMMDLVQQRCQFIIATHSPILMAFPGAALLSCDETPLREVAFDDLEHVKLTKAFLNDPERFLRRLKSSE
jgi:predicted ATPase